MRRKSFPQALDAALSPFGFVRDGDDWVRVRGDMWECVNRQSFWLGGVTANLFQMDIKTEALYIEVFGPDEPRPFVAQDKRIGQLINGYDRWWKKDEPDGPTEMAQAVLTYGLPWFDRVRTLEDQAVQWYSRDGILASKRAYGQQVIVLALTLYRMGQYDDACRILQNPAPRHPLPGFVERTEKLRAWLDKHPPP